MQISANVVPKTKPIPRIPEVYVYKTSVQELQFQKVKPILNNLLPDAKWNFDFEDCDNILRIESKRNVTSSVVYGLSQGGFICEELV